MSKKGSLVSSSDFDSIGRKSSGGGKKSGGGKSNDKIKIGIAVGLLGVAGLLLAWNFGVIDTTPTPPPPTAEEIQAHQEQVQEIERLVEQGVIEAPAGE